MRVLPCLLLVLAAGCNFPELARAPETPLGPAPHLQPLGPLLPEEEEEPDAEADAALEARAAALRARAAALPTDPIGPERRAAMEAVGQR